MIAKGKSISHGTAALEYDLAKEINGDQANALIFISCYFNFLTFIINQVKQVQVFYGSFLFSRHLVFISFQCGTWTGHRIYYP